MHDENSTGTIARHLLITGRVQGVYYRASAQAEGERLGLHGWVRNRRDGAVEAVAAGSPEAVDQFIAWARRGPSAARVDRVEVTEAEAPNDQGFSVKQTA